MILTEQRERGQEVRIAEWRSWRVVCMEGAEAGMGDGSGSAPGAGDTWKSADV